MDIRQPRKLIKTAMVTTVFLFFSLFLCQASLAESNDLNQNADGVSYQIDDREIALFWGEKSTAGYSIMITNVFYENNSLLVTYSLQTPDPDKMYPTVITYPEARSLLPEDTRTIDRVIIVNEESIDRNSIHDEVLVSVNDQKIELSWGEKPSGGYEISIIETNFIQGHMIISYSLKSPAPYTPVPMVLTYPKVETSIPEAITNAADMKHVVLLNQSNPNQEWNDYLQQTYTDIPNDYWAGEEIFYLSLNEFLSGYPDGKFMPKQYVTRAEAAAILARVFYLYPTEPGRLAFSDVNQDFWAYEAIQASVEAGLFIGFNDQTFKPNQTLTRAEMAALLTRSFRLKGETTNEFTDVSTEHWAFEAIQALRANGITNGYRSIELFAPSQPTQRDELAVFLSRALLPEHFGIK
ncbi:S-layer homology domain-containing protein [Anaerobacillus sp. MEB173]|uniref:S-layer homology domain-containing protein n=1 Tax=Anaerobacillus sp. MEB173 TaxID=3383345 RepID=UPI003F8FAE32